MAEQMERRVSLSLYTLQREGILRIGQKPRENPKEIPQKGQFAIFLSEEDYPALTPAMWNRVAEELEFDFQMIFFVAEPRHLEAILAASRGEPRLKGGVFGVGFKDEAMKLLDQVEPIVAVSNSSNLFVKTAENKLAGFNTDAEGFVKSLVGKLEELGKLPLNDKKIVVLGAGGTGSAIAFLLADKVKELVVINRTIDKAQQVASSINSFYKEDLVKFNGEGQMAAEISRADVIINTTVKGAAGQFASFSAFAPAGGEWTVERNLKQAEELLSRLESKPLVCDIVLAETNTPTISLAKKFGLPTLDGRPMNLEQSIPAINLVFPQLNQISQSKLREIMSQAQNG